VKIPLAAALSPLFCAAASAQPVVNAGLDQTLAPGRLVTRFAGGVANLTALEFWVADGDNLTENMLLKYHSTSGITAVGPLQSSSGQTYGWPSDIEQVAGTYYGIDTFHRRIYTLDPATGLCTPVGGQTGWTTLFGLAYDFDTDTLYGVDRNTRDLIVFDRSTGAGTAILKLPVQHADVRGIAYRKSDRKLYYCDDFTESIHRVDPVTGTVEFVLALNDGPNAKVDELDFFHGRLFVSYRAFEPGTSLWSMQLVQVDVDAGEVESFGPVVDDCSAHSLIVLSLPEHVEWRQTSGPALARVEREHDPRSPVSFPAAGTYAFELRAEGPGGTFTDSVSITVPGASARSGGGPPIRRQ
jgi:hypothetical protein